MKRQENDKKDAERKKAHPNYKNIYMHLMDETPDIVEKITEKNKKENEIKIKRKEERKKVADEKKSYRKHQKKWKNYMKKQQKKTE